MPKGKNRPYSTSAGDYYIKSGPDKKKMSQEQLRRLFAESSLLFADENIVPKSDITHLNSDKFNKFLKQENPIVFTKLINKELDLETVLGNLNLLTDGHLTLAGNLLFGETPQRFNPLFYVDCCYFDGNDVSVTKFISKQTMQGTFKEIYEDSFRFIVSQLRSHQIEDDFNSNAQLEINKEVLTELIVNALIHRDYYINSSIKIFMFHDRIEIISPGKLINSLTVGKIKNGIAIHRNPILSSICKSLLPYTGYGSGIKRVLQLNPEVEFINNTNMEQFKSIIYRTKLGENQNKLGENQKRLGEKQNKLGENQNIELSKNKQLILKLMNQNPKITIRKLSDELGITATSIEKNIKTLKQINRIQRIGADKGGHWEVLEK